MRFRAGTVAISLITLALVLPVAEAGQPPGGSVDKALTEAARLTKEGKTEQAISILQQALEQDPKMTEGWVQLGNTQLSVGRPLQAAKAYQSALGLAPGLQDVRYNLAYVLRQTGQFKEAAAAYQAYLKATPKDADALFGLAESLKGDEQWLAAAEAYDMYAATERRPDQQKWVQKARDQAAELRKRAGADETAGPAVAAAPLPNAAPVGAAPPAAGAAPAPQGPMADGDAAAQPQVAPGPPSATDAPEVAMPVAGDRTEDFTLGLKALEKNDFAGALERLKAAAKATSEDPMVLVALGSAHLGVQDAKSALSTYQSALAKNPPPTLVPAIQFGIAEAQRMNRDDEAATVAFRRVLSDETTPENLRVLAEQRIEALER